MVLFLRASGAQEAEFTHGINPYSGPLRISIRTRHTEAGTEIVVEDNGPGFVPEGDSKPHTTLKNIQQRLEMMCRGAMTITPGREAEPWSR